MIILIVLAVLVAAQTAVQIVALVKMQSAVTQIQDPTKTLLQNLGMNPDGAPNAP